MEVTVEEQGTTLMVGGAATNFDTGPLSGSKLAPEQAEQVRLRLPQGPIFGMTTAPSISSGVKFL
jgi:hypothetical protein